MGTIYRNGTAFIGSGGAGGVELTQAEYDALPTTEKMNGSIYFISDGETSYPSASTMRYDNSTSGLTATSVQAAVDEVNEKVNDNAGDIATLNNDLSALDATVTNGFADRPTMIYTSIINGGTSKTVSGLASGRAMLVILMYGAAGVMITATNDGACVFGEVNHGITVSVSNSTLTINNGSSRNYRVTVLKV